MAQLPCLFASVSTVKTSIDPVEAINVLTSVGFPQLLVSAYDLDHLTAKARRHAYSTLEEARAKGSRVLLDSGNYESTWLRDTKNWTRNRFHRVLRQCPHDVAMSFDQIESGESPQRVSEIVLGAHEDAEVCGSKIIPIVHWTGDANRLAGRVKAVARSLKPVAIAVAERELGDGLLERARSVSRIRRGLARAGLDTPLHVLGTANPLTLLLLSAAGADSFDGLEWCQTVVDHETAHLHHFQHYDLFRHQTPYGRVDLPFAQACLGHNLAFFKHWMSKIRELIVAAGAGVGHRQRISLVALPPGIAAHLRTHAKVWVADDASA